MKYVVRQISLEYTMYFIFKHHETHNVSYSSNRNWNNEPYRFTQSEYINSCTKDRPGYLGSGPRHHLPSTVCIPFIKYLYSEKNCKNSHQSVHLHISKGDAIHSVPVASSNVATGSRSQLDLTGRLKLRLKLYGT